MNLNCFQIGIIYFGWVMSGLGDSDQNIVDHLAKYSFHFFWFEYALFLVHKFGLEMEIIISFFIFKVMICFHFRLEDFNRHDYQNLDYWIFYH